MMNEKPLKKQARKSIMITQSTKTTKINNSDDSYSDNDEFIIH